MNQDEEIWKDVPGFEREYQVSNYGNIRSLDRHRTQYFKKTDVIILRFFAGRVLKPQENNRGYLSVALVKSTNRISIHRLVAITFIPNPDNLPTVDHIDRNKTNNHVSNLRWATHEQQMANVVRQWISYESTRNRSIKWRFRFKQTGVSRYFLNRELAEKFRDEYFEKIGFQMLK